MELFLLIAIGITVISFISIVLTNPSSIISPELLNEPGTDELLTENEAESPDTSTELEELPSQTEEQLHVEKEIMAPLA